MAEESASAEQSADAASAVPNGAEASRGIGDDAGEDHKEFTQFVQTVAALRAPDGCPWDRSQTHKSISSYMVEEAYEAVDAFEADDIPHMREELGDVLLQVVLQSQIAADAGEFDIDDVCRDINAKMIRRHPHVFGDAKVETASEVNGIWAEAKRAERQARGSRGAGEGASLLDSVPTSFPALLQAQKISRKAAAAGFEWETLGDVWDQVAQERAELEEAYTHAPKAPDGKIVINAAVDAKAFAASDSKDMKASAAAQMEFGDLLFSLVNVARRMGIDAEEALRMSCGKFRGRWRVIEEGARQEGKSVEDLSQQEMERYWQQAKERE